MPTWRIVVWFFLVAIAIGIGIDWAINAGAERLKNLSGEGAAWLRGIGFFLAGVAIAPVGIFLANQRTKSLQEQTKNEVAQRITDAFTKAVELFGNQTLAVRQGGIYALGRLAQENRGEHPKIMDIIAAYIRDQGVVYADSIVAKILESEEEEKKMLEKAGRTGLIDRSRQGVIKEIVSNLPMPIDLDAAIAVIRERKIEHDPSGGQIFDLSNTYIFNADLNGISLTRPNFSDSKIYGCVLADTQIIGANMAKADFYNTDLRSADLSYADAMSANFYEADMSDTNWEKAVMVGAFFSSSDMRDANFRNAGMPFVIFANTQVAGACFDNADLSDADMSAALGLIQEQVDSANGNENTQLPKGIKRPEKWAEQAGK